MEKEKAIQYLENLKLGHFITINIPIDRHTVVGVTALYLGKDKDGRYSFRDSGEITLSRNLLEKGKITIDKYFDTDVAIKIQKKIDKERKVKNNKER